MKLRTRLISTPLLLLLSLFIAPISASFADEAPAEEAAGTETPAKKAKEEPDC